MAPSVVYNLCRWFIAAKFQLTPAHQIMRTRFYQSTAKPSGHIQRIARKHKKVQLTKEARAAINARRREASKQYKQDVDKVWAELCEKTENLASTHHKSVRRVQSELHLGQSLAHRRHAKPNAWNAFCWKKRISLKENGDDESKSLSL